MSFFYNSVVKGILIFGTLIWVVGQVVSSREMKGEMSTDWEMGG